MPSPRNQWQELFDRTPGAKRWPALIYVMIGRLVLLTILLVAGTALKGTDDVSFYAFVGLAFVCTIPFSLWLRGNPRTQSGAMSHFVIDVMIVTGIVHYTGGASSQMCLLYPLVILAAGIVVSGRLAVHTAVLSMLLYATLIALELQGALIYRGPSPSPYDHASLVVQHTILRLVMFGFFAAASSYLSNRCGQHTRQLQRLRLIVDFVFDNVSTALLAVERDGRIVLANSAASKLLDIPPESVEKHTLMDFFHDEPPSLDDAAATTRVWRMRRLDGSTFPGAFEASLASFPVGPHAEDGAVEEKERYVIALRDMTQALQLQEKANESIRLQTAVDMATEVAHWVRNPLTAIKVADELVASVLAGGSAEDVDFSNEDLDLVSAMCQIIAQETQRLENRVNSFLNCADQEDRTRLLDVICEAKQWSKRVRPAGGERDEEHPRRR